MGENLFWAIRGGGGGSFGIVSWRVNLVYVPAVVTVFWVFQTLEEDMTNIFYKWQSVAPVLPKELDIRTPPLWGTMKFLSEKIPKDTSSKVRINRDLYSSEKIMETVPTLPDFALALKPDEFQLPPMHTSTKLINDGKTLFLL